MSNRPRTLLDLPDNEIARLRAGLNGVCLGMNRSAARVIEAAGSGPTAQLSPKMRHALIRIAYRYRRQLPHSYLPFFLRFTREELASRPQDHTWHFVSPTNGNVPFQAEAAIGQCSKVTEHAQLGLGV